MIEELSKTHAVGDLCQLLGVTRSGYYAWCCGSETSREANNRKLAEEIKEVFEAKRGRYGSPRITEELRRKGHKCNHKRVERLMRQAQLKGRTCRRKKVRTTNSDHDEPIAPNLLLARPAPSKTDEVWVADITYVPTADGWLFVAAVMDLYSRQILGWSVWESLMAGGALQALARALVKRGHPSYRSNSSFGSGCAVCLWAIPTPVTGTRLGGQHEPQRQLLRQCSDGSLLEHA